MSCPICFSESVNPVLTRCGHSGCFDCVLRWSAVQEIKHGRPYPSCFMCRQTYNDILTLYGEEVQRLNSFDGIIIPDGISPLEYARNGFYHINRLAAAFEYSIRNAVLCFDCGHLHYLKDSTDLDSLKIAHLTKFPNCRTARSNIMGLDLI
jgi:hypothetical protein